MHEQTSRVGVFRSIFRIISVYLRPFCCSTDLYKTQPHAKLSPEPSNDISLFGSTSTSTSSKILVGASFCSSIIELILIMFKWRADLVSRPSEHALQDPARASSVAQVFQDAMMQVNYILVF